MKKALFRMAGAFVVVFALVSPLFAIDVYLDGAKIDFDVEPTVINNRTMVPLRAIFEKLGAEVSWHQETQSVTAFRDGKHVSLTLGKPSICVDDSKFALDVSPVAIDGRTLVPLRAVSEAFDVRVEWDQALSAFGMTTSGEKPMIPGYAYDNYFITSLDPKNYLKLFIDGSRVYYEGVFSYDELTAVSFSVSAQDSFADAVPDVVYNDNAMDSGYYKLKQGELLSGYFDIAGDSIYKVSIGMYYPVQNDGNSAYNQLYENICIAKKDGRYVFLNSEVFEHNSRVMNSLYEPWRYLRLDQLSEDEYAAVVGLAEEVCEGITDNYAKVKAIHDFIVKSTYYNYDYVDTDGDGYQDGINYDTSAEIIINGFTQCWGMSILFTDMCRAVGIPATKVVGPTRYDSLSEEFDVDQSNHAWNVAYVNGRWIIVDATWNNHNSYSLGEYTDGLHENEYFNIELDVISHDHRFDYFREAHDWYAPEIPLLEEWELKNVEPVGLGVFGSERAA